MLDGENEGRIVFNTNRLIKAYLEVAVVIIINVVVVIIINNADCSGIL
jgi:hypothetical protein